MATKPKRPRDVSQRAKLIVDIATGEVEDEPCAPDEEKQRSGKLGGIRRAAKLSPEEKSEIARKAAKARWRQSK